MTDTDHQRHGRNEMTTLEHIVRFEAGYDCINFECKFNKPNCKPGKGNSHGKHGLEMRFVVKGDAGAVQFLLSTGWLPQRVLPDGIHVRHLNLETSKTFPLPADLGYHSKKPHYAGQEPIDGSCEFCDGQPCYYDGSSLNANDAMYALVNGGDKALWAFLDAYYVHVFEGGEYPTPAEYPAKRRGD